MARRLSGVALLALFAGACTRAADPPAAPDAPVVVVDSGGKEVKLRSVKMTGGFHRLAWLADPKGTTDDAKKGPLALELREPNSTTYVKGVLTLVPLGCIEAVRYDTERQTVTVKGLTEPLTGTLQFKGFNVVSFEGDADGLTTKFTGGVPKGGFRSITFPAAKPFHSHKPGGTEWKVQIDQPKAGNPTLAVRNLKALYHFPNGSEVLAGEIPVRKGRTPLKFDASLKKLEFLAIDTNTHMAAAEVCEDAAPECTVVIPLTTERDGKTGTMVGLVGEVDVGWKLFPLHAIKVIKPGP